MAQVMADRQKQQQLTDEGLLKPASLLITAAAAADWSAYCFCRVVDILAAAPGGPEPRVRVLSNSPTVTTFGNSHQQPDHSMLALWCKAGNPINHPPVRKCRPGFVARWFYCFLQCNCMSKPASRQCLSALCMCKARYLYQQEDLH